MAVDSATERHEAVLAELERILASAAFRNARRSQELLRYVVINALEGRADSLKERTIGASVFQRPPDYDTGDDSIVRVKASELRKRLAQYYQETGPAHAVRIDLPAGSYLPEFRWPSEPAAAPPPPRRSWKWAAIPAAVVLAGLAGIALLSRGGTTAVDEFWDPVVRTRKPVLLCVANPVVYTLGGATATLLRSGAAPKTIPFADLQRDLDNFVGYGDAFTLGQLSGFLSRRGKSFSIRMGNDMSFADLRNSPAVLIGAFTNQWTLEMTSNLRYVFDWDGPRAIIKDRMEPSKRWVREDASPAADFVLLSRIFNSRSGEMVITAAGLGHIGTQMAGEFLTNPDHLQQALRSAPQDWQRRNLQLVVTGEVIGKTPGPPKVVANWYW
jgi:hypothetical protein